jgi:predicted  nucleic acid-binding Zn-ribbon protein
VKRSRYDIKRQTAGLSNITLGKRSGARHVQPYDCAIVFWTECPHCQKRFVYYQWNFLAICDDCGKNFFAFKLSEQAVPSRFLSVGLGNSHVSQKMVSCQQHGVPDQLIQDTELRSAEGSVAPETTVDATCTEEHITWAGTSGVHGKGSSETRSNVVQCSAVN